MNKRPELLHIPYYQRFGISPEVLMKTPIVTLNEDKNTVDEESTGKREELLNRIEERKNMQMDQMIEYALNERKEYIKNAEKKDIVEEIKETRKLTLHSMYGQQGTMEDMMKDISFKPQSKILNLPENLHIIKYNKYDRTYISDMEYSYEETDEICKVFNPIFDKELIDEFPEAMDNDNMFSMMKTCQLSTTLSIRWSYVYRAGFAVVTKVFADHLAEYLKGKKCLEIMAGKGVISKALKDRGVDIIATDNFSWHNRKVFDERWTDVIEMEAGDAIRKYNDVDVIIVSWMPLDVKGKRIARMIRKYNPNAKIISIEEDCTANESWYDRVEYLDDDKFNATYLSYKSWMGIHDKPMLCEISKPWKR